MGDDVCFLSPVEVSPSECGVDLVAELAAAELNPLSRIEDGSDHQQAFFTEMLSDAAEVFDSEFYAEAEDAVDQNDVHGPS